ncbi:hypothetical protein Glove_856g18 [Diversispora epigaea]|uniref:Uncharacterized protein n=1 Tax=Diversispora epigaea TaxID=1348612 RepID=A0A397G122_9GLOM|nr:hypothetical protein Glove_856g18 [Diversispora epigaea]
MSNCEENEINENIEIVDFFDNIPENNDDINLFTEIAINKAKKLLNKENEFENIEDTEDTDSEIESIASTIVTKNIDDDDYEIEIPQTAGSHLTSCALIDKIDGKIQRCGDTKNLRGIVQLIGIWQLDDNAVNEAGKEIENLGINENIEIVDFFDNIPENNDDINLFTEIAINKAKKLLNKENEFENIEDTEDTDSEIESIASTIVTKNIDDDDYEIEIPQTAGSHLTSCALIDKIDGKIQRCGDTKNLRGIVQLIGIWQLDDNAVNEAGKEIENLGVCQQHFMFDQNRLHKKGTKQEQNIINSYLHRRRCRFCGLNFYFFSYGKFCLEHSISIGGKNLLLPCIGHKLCPVLQINEPFTVSAKLQQVSRFLCCDCYEKHDGHLYVRPGRGKVIQECETQGKWIINLSNSNNELLKNKILKNITIAIEQSLNTTSDESSFANNNYDNTIPIYKSPSLLFVKVLFKLYNINIEKETNYNFQEDDYYKIGLQIGLNLIKNRKQILQKKQALEEPQSLEEYCSALPVELYNLLNGIIQILFKKKRQAANQVQKSRNSDNNNFQQINIKKIQKIIIFICSIIITIGFKNTKIWLTRMISSLCRKPRLFTNLHDFLVLVSVSGVTRRYERCLETQRMELADPTLRVQQSSNIWNVCVIDNIDFKEKTFTYGNIYDTTRTSSHATLCLLFQFKLPIEINSISNDEIQLDENTKLFEENSITKEVITIFNSIFIQLLNFHINNDFSIQYSSSYNVEIFNEKIRNYFCNDNLSNYPPAHLVILEAGDNPNNDANINAACEQYFNDLKINNNSKIEVVGDEAIFRRILKYYQNNSRIRPLLGQWHTSKDMCSVLLTIFSVYGIYNMAAILEVVFLDKLEKVVNYRSTCRILDLIWIAVGRKWIINLSNSNNELLKNKILKNITIAIEQSLNTTSDESSFANNNYDNTIPIYKSPSLLFVKVLFKLYNINIEKETNYNFQEDDYYKIGLQIGLNLIKNRKQILQKKQALEEPQSLEEYCSALPVELYNLLNGIIQILFKKKRQAANQVQKSRNSDNNNFQQINIKKIQKIIIFICSIIITIGFKNTKIWLTRMISSLCRKPRLFTNLHDFLVLVSVSGVTRRYERCLETQRMELADPTLRVQQSSNIWNVCVIDNIDFKEKTFTYGNIYDTTRTSSHATLCLLFQFKLPIEINSISNDEIQLDENTKLFEENSITKEVITIFNSIFIQLLNFHINNDFSIQYSSSYNVEIFNEKIRNYFCNDNLSNYPPAHLVILEAGDNPNNDANINAACEQYFNDLKINNNSKIEVVGDEAIFRRILKYYQNNSRIRPLLGQWHTSKDMCSVLLTIFSVYGIYNMAAILEVVFLDKLEKVVNYRSTCRILDLIWIAVGSAIHIYIKKKNLNFNNIMDMENNLLKTWFCFYKWTSYWKGHRTGICTGNNELQIQCLSAFSPLFPIAGKINYTRSTIHFLAIIAKNPKIQTLLKYASSVNLTQNGHYFAFDEALETFGAKFIKQNITGNVVDEKNLKRQIKAAQSEKERMNLLLDEFLDDIVLLTTTRAIKERHEVLWKLINQLLEAFEMENGTYHPLFQNCNQLTTEGFEKLYRCYQDGTVRLDKIFQQEILCLQVIDTKGCRLKRKIKKNIKKRTNPFNNPPNESLTQERNELPTFESSEIIPVNEQKSPKKIKIARHSPSKEEKDILKTLFAYDIRPSDTIRDAWGYEKRKEKKIPKE